MGRPTIGQQAMTAAERKARSRNLQASAIYAEADFAAQHIQNARQALARTIGGSETDHNLLMALDAISRLQQLIRP